MRTSIVLRGERFRILRGAFAQKVLRRPSPLPKPNSSSVLEEQLRQRDYPHWTAWYVPYCDVKNDLWGRSHFNFDVDGRNYHVLRTGAFPFVKFHCSRRPPGQDLFLEDKFYNALKVLNFGLPTLVYGLAGLLWARHRETVRTELGSVTVYFWYKETANARS